MNVSDLMEKLKAIPGDYEVIVLGQGGSEGCECPADVSVNDRARWVMVKEEKEEGERSTSRDDLLKLCRE